MIPEEVGHRSFIEIPLKIWFNTMNQEMVVVSKDKDHRPVMSNFPISRHTNSGLYIPLRFFFL
jgi:hypothetical protein